MKNIQYTYNNTLKQQDALIDNVSWIFLLNDMEGQNNQTHNIYKTRNPGVQNKMNFWIF